MNAWLPNRLVIDVEKEVLQQVSDACELIKGQRSVFAKYSPHLMIRSQSIYHQLAVVSVVATDEIINKILSNQKTERGKNGIRRV